MTDIERPPFPKFVDATMLVTGKACMRRMYHSSFQHLKPATVSIDLHAGGAFAQGIQTVRELHWGDADTPPLEDFDLCLAKGLEAMAKYWGDYEAPEGHQKSYDRMAGALVDYFREYGIKTDPIKPHIGANGKPAVEYTFAVPLDIPHPETGDPILYAGRFDLLGHYNNMLAIVDEKTTKQLGASWVRQWNLRSQFLGYSWALQQVGLKPQICIIRGVAILKTKYTHAQAIISYPDWQINRWAQQMHQDVRRFIRAWEAHNTGDRLAFGYDYGDACSSYGGCSYMDLCTSPNPDRWYDQYVIRPWNPLQKDPSKREEPITKGVV